LIGRLEIPRIGLSAIVLEGDDKRTLQLGVGHLRGTALPGAPGNVVLAAHRDTFFRPLRNIREGDRITVTTTHGIQDYWVDSAAVVDPDHTQALQASLQPTLTLVTCYPFAYIGTAPQRFIVQAREGGGQRPPSAEPAAGRWHAADVATALRQHETRPATSTRNAASFDRADTVETASDTAADNSLPRPNHGIKRIPGRIFGKLAGIVRRRGKQADERQTAEVKGEL
jgi:LPXTG-site transpeptidase (sortase) family protein